MKKKRNNILILCFCLVFAVILIIGVSNVIKRQNAKQITNYAYINKMQKIKELEKKHAITKTLENAAKVKNANVRFYDKDNLSTLDFKMLTNKLATGELSTVSLFMYSDGCPRCYAERKQLAKFVCKSGNKSNLILAVNKERGNKFLKKHFQLPSYYHYPSLFTYTDDSTEDGKLILVKNQFLDDL